MAKGRKATPTEIKKARGNPGRRKLNTEEPQPPKVIVGPWGAGEATAAAGAILACDVPPPAHLDEHAAAKWRTMVLLLAEIRVLTSADLSGLANYCIAYSEVVQAQAVLATAGRYITNPETGMTIKHPALNSQREHILVMLRYEAEFGLTPSSRSRVKALPPAAQNPFTRNGRRPS
ncbi:MAG: phage terminase small subunit P27 family [Betaproteobacteria bacterium]|nr:phage terminase small subunit P27 family [Betaproteobacteria bacterium]